MEGTGLSLFQGSESLRVDNSAQREEEQEALADQQIRNKELENLLTNAFDDLSFDDDDGSSVVSDDAQHTPAYLSGGGDGSVSTHYKHCFRASPASPGSNDHLEESNRRSSPAHPNEDSKNMEQLQVLYDVRVREIQRLSQETEKCRRLVALRDAEKERLQITLTQQANQLTAASGRTADLEAEITTLKQNIVNSEKSKTLVARELRSYRSAAADLQTRVDALQRGAATEPNSAVLLRDAQSKLAELQGTLETTDKNLALKTVELDKLTRKMADTARDYETLLSGKVDAIGKLTASLEASQKQVQQLKVAKELNGKLKEELERCIAGGRVKVEENKKLEELLDKKEATIHALRNQESRDITQFNTHKDQVSQLQNECKRHELKETELLALNGKLEADVAKLKLDLEMAAETIKPVELELKEDKDDVKQLQQQIQQLGEKLAAAQAENEHVKKLYVEVCSTKEQIVAELTSLRTERDNNERKETERVPANGQPMSAEKSTVWSEECRRLRSEVEKCRSQVAASERQVSDLNVELEKASEEKLRLLIRVHQMDDQSNVSTGALDSMDGDVDNARDKLQRLFDTKLEQEIAKYQRLLKEMEETIKDETVKLFTEDLLALEAKRDQAIRRWEQSENRLAEMQRNFNQSEVKSRQVIKTLEKKLIDLQTEFEKKVMNLVEAEKRFEQFQTTCSEEFRNLTLKYSKNLEKANKKYSSYKKKAGDFKRFVTAKEEHLRSECKRFEDGYRVALCEVQHRMQFLLDLKVLNSLDTNISTNIK